MDKEVKKENTYVYIPNINQKEKEAMASLRGRLLFTINKLAYLFIYYLFLLLV